MKKKFKETGFGKFLTGKAASGIIKSIPFGVGSIAGNILDEVNGSQSGEVDKKSIFPQIIKLCFYAILAYLLSTGNITVDGFTAIVERISS